MNSDDKIILYEAFFLENAVVEQLFKDTRGENPFGIVTQNYHVTTCFMPDTSHEQWYGKKVNVHILSYKSQDVIDDNNCMTSNEGFKVSISAADKDLNDYILSLDKNYHITGSYKDMAKYTEYVDFSDGIKMDINILGIFGCEYVDGTIFLG